MKKRHLLVALALFLFLSITALFIACGGSSSGTSESSSNTSRSVKLTGTVSSSDYDTAAITKNDSFFAGLFTFVSKAYAVMILQPVNKVVAVPLEGGEFHGSMMTDSVSADVDSDGSFSINLSKHYDWILLLMDTVSGDFAGYVSLMASDTESLIEVPVTGAATSNIDLGTVSAFGDIALSQYTTSATDFSMTPEQLLILARNDDLLKGVTNLVNNYDDATGLFYYLRPDFIFNGDYATIENAFAAVTSYQYRNYEFQLDSNQTAVTMDHVCGDGVTPVILELFPPPLSNISTTTPSVYFTPDVPMSSDGTTCSVNAGGNTEASADNTQFYATNAYEDVSFEFGSGLRGTIPEGDWTFKIDDAITGTFNVSVATPLGANGKIKGAIPVIKAVTDESKKITSVAVKWYTSTDGVTYEELADISILKHLVGSGDIYLDGQDGEGKRRYESIHFDPDTDTSVTPSWTWYYGDNGPAAEQATSLGVFFNAAGIGHHLQYFEAR